jgi:hypothetical protein
MPKKKPDAKPADPVVSLDSVRKKRELDEITNHLRSLSGQMTGAIAEVIARYHAWEVEHPDKAVLPVVKLEMIELGFIGRAGYARCHEEHRLPSYALYGSWTGGVIPTDEELSQNAMCPALERRRCRTVLEVFGVPPCIFLGGEVQQALAPDSLANIVEAVLAGEWRDSPEEEKKRFARAERLIRKYEKLEEADDAKPRK